MKLEVQVRFLSGPLAGETRVLAVGDVIGRSKGSFLLADEKVSARHAEIQIGSASRLKLVDLGSSNGIFAEGERVDEVIFARGIHIRVGTSEFVVEDAPEDVTRTKFSIPESDDAVAAWKGKVLELLDETIQRARQLDAPSSPPQFFHEAVELLAEEGPLMGTRWTLAYGPRVIGRSSRDLRLLDTESDAFTLFPGPGGVSYRPESPETRLNGQFVTEAQLRPGDKITYGTHSWTVSFPRK